jgi:hypothetical protein
LVGGAAAFTAFRKRSPATIRGIGLSVGLLGGALATYALVGLRQRTARRTGVCGDRHWPLRRGSWAAWLWWLVRSEFVPIRASTGRFSSR